MKTMGKSTKNHNKRGILGNLLLAGAATAAIVTGGCKLKEKSEQAKKVDHVAETMAGFGKAQEGQAVATRKALDGQNERLDTIQEQTGAIQAKQDEHGKSLNEYGKSLKDFAEKTAKSMTENSKQIDEGFKSVRETMQTEMGKVNEGMENIGDRVDNLDERTRNIELVRSAGMSSKHKVKDASFYLTRKVEGDSETLSIFNSDDQLIEMLVRNVSGSNVFVDSTETPVSGKKKRRLGLYTGQEAKAHTASYTNLIERILSLSSSAEKAKAPKPFHVLLPKFYFEMMAESWEEGNSKGRDLANAEAEIRKAMKGTDDAKIEAAVMKIRGIMAKNAAPKPKDVKEDKYTVENAKFYLVKAVEGNSETLSIFDSNDKLVETLVRYVKGDKVFVDSPGSAGAGRRLKVYKGDEAKSHTENYKRLIETIVKASKEKNAEEFKKAIEELRKIDDKAQYTLDDAAAKQLFSIFQASGKGAHISASSTSVPGDHLGRDNIILSRNAAKTQYNLNSGDEALRVLDVVTQGVPDDYVMISVTDSTKGVIGKKERAEKFKKALDELMGIDNKAQYTLEDEKAMDILFTFLASGQGAYVSAGRTSVPGKHFGMDSITIEDSIAKQKEKEKPATSAAPTTPTIPSTLQKKDATYTVRSGDLFIRRIKAVTEGVPAGYVKLEVMDSTTKDGSPAEAYSLEMPKPYFDAMVAALGAGNANGRTETIAEADKAAKAAALKTSKDNKRKRRKELSKEYQRGFEVRGMQVDDKNFSAFADFSVGGEDGNFRVKGGVDERAYELNGDDVESTRTFGEMRYSFRLRKTPTGATAKGGPQLDISFFGENADTEVDMPAKDPVVSVDGTGRYRTTNTFLGGDSHEVSGLLSLGIDTSWPSEKGFFNLGFWGENTELDYHQEIDILIEDLTSVDPDINNTPVIDGKVTAEMTGVEIHGGFPLDDNNKYQLSILFGLSNGSLNDQVSPEIDLSELDLAFGYRSFGKFTAGGIWVRSEVGTDTYNSGHITVSPVFTPNDYVALALNANVTFPGSTDDVVLPDGTTVEQDASSLWGFGIMLAAGGDGKSSRTAEAIERYNAQNMHESWTHRYSPRMKSILRDIRRDDMIRDSDSEFFLDLNGREAYGTDGEKTLHGDITLIVAHQFQSGAKILYDLGYNSDEFGESYGAGVGFLNTGNGTFRVGYKRINIGDDALDAIELALKIGF